MERYLLTYEDAKSIVKKYNDFNFSETLHRIDNYKISTFSYFLCGYNDFADPLNNGIVNGFDMRGITFVFNEDGTLWKRFFMLPKFFNINQVESTQYDLIKDKKISHITTKEDGSLIAFMMLPNGKIFSKTIAGFSNEQSVKAMLILIENNWVDWVSTILNLGFTPLFEYVSYDNRIVLQYRNPELRLIGFRDNTNGDYVPARLTSLTLSTPSDMYVVKSVNYTLKKLIELGITTENVEGWVIMFEDGQLVKIKTDWYFKMHGLRADNVFREDFIIKNYYEESIDDIIAQLDSVADSDALNFINYVIDAIKVYEKHINKIVSELNNVLLVKYNNDWVKFATENHNSPFFGLVKYFTNKKEYKDRKVNLILRNTSKLNKAKDIIERFSKRKLKI